MKTFKETREISTSKTIIENINREQAEKISSENAEYLTWIDGTSITTDEIEKDFRVTEYSNGQINLELKGEDFRIENIIGG
jgi:hypothetical protein